MGFLQDIKKSWNIFRSQSSIKPHVDYSGLVSYGQRPDRVRLRTYNDQSIVTSIYNRISIDVAALDFKHVSLGDNERFSGVINSNLNDCLNLEANIDQSPRAFKQDIVLTMLTKGTAAIIPIDVTKNPNTNEVYDVYTLRVGEIVAWYSDHVKVEVYNEKVGRREPVVLEKRFVAIADNPLYSVMNESNSTLQRLLRKLVLLDAIDEQSGSGKLDLIIQLPYVIKSEARRQAAEQRRQDIEFQLKGSQYGIAYTDGSERVTQLNRPAENNLLKQIEYLTTMLYGQLGITEEVMNGTADEKAMLNYYNRTVEPIAASIREAMQRSFIPRTSKQRKERIEYFNDPFKLVPLSDFAELADKFTRNEILTANEIRGFVGLTPSDDPKADKLINSNMPQPNDESLHTDNSGLDDPVEDLMND